MAFSHIRRSDLIRLDYDGKILTGSGKQRLVNKATLFIHAAGVVPHPPLEKYSS
jgi:hypothetical protein